MSSACVYVSTSTSCSGQALQHSPAGAHDTQWASVPVANPVGAAIRQRRQLSVEGPTIISLANPLSSHTNPALLPDRKV